MTPEQFKEALLKGRGRCVNAVRADPMKYRSVALWACRTGDGSKPLKKS